MNFSKIFNPLSDLLMKDVECEFDDNYLYVFQVLKEKLISCPVLVGPDWSLLYELMCDASDTTIEVILSQSKDKVLYNIYYKSRTLNEVQPNYANTGKESLTVNFAFDKFRSYLVGSKFIIYTNHSALKYLLTKK